MTRLSAHEEPLAKIFSSEYQFAIPDYQRPYSWTPEQALQLLADLTDALDRESSNEPYFLGSIVLVKAEGVPAAEVIDGQQRLTTVTILLAVLRDLTDSEELRKSFNEMISEPGSALRELAEQPRLTLRSRDKEFFRRYVQDGAIAALLTLDDGHLATDAQRNIRDNAVKLHQALSTGTDEQSTPWTEERRISLAKMLSNRTFLVSVATSDIVSAHRIFNVMNSRGLDLSAADIFKSTVIGSINDSLSEEYATRWEDAEENLGRQSFQDLFLHIRTIYARTRPQREILLEFPDQVLNQFLPTRAATFVDDVLLPYAEAYATIENESYSWPVGAEGVNSWLNRLNRVDNNDWKPVALWLLHQYKADPAKLTAHLAKLERLVAVQLVTRVYATPRAMRYANLIKSLDDGLGTDAPEFAISDGERRSVMLQLNGPIYELASVRKYVLYRLNEIVSSAPVSFNVKIMTVEHVLPQNPRAGSIWLNDFTENERDYWVHRLANLVLLDKKKNSEAQNYDFALKKSRYFSSVSGTTPFTLSTEVLATDVWTPAVLRIRQLRLLALLAETWDVARDSDGASLLELTEADIAATADENPATSGKSGRRVTLADLLRTDLVTADTSLRWSRPRLGDIHHAWITAEGQLRLEDGRLFDTPSRAAKEAAGVDAVDGWDAWVMPNGEKLGSLWQKYQNLIAESPLAASD